MSTRYAVAMPLPEFIAASAELGWTLERSPNEGERGRLRLVDGSEYGCAYDPVEHRAPDGSPWTLFTRYGGSDVSGLADALGAIDEYGDEFLDLFETCDAEDDDPAS